MYKCEKCEKGINAQAAGRKLISISWTDDDGQECSLSMGGRNQFTLERGSLRIGIPTGKMKELVGILVHYKDW